MTDLREMRRRQAQEQAAKDKRRLFLFLIGLVVCLAIVLQLEFFGDDGDQGVQQSEEQVNSVVAAPELDEGLLAQVEDATLAQQVILEPEPFAYVADQAKALLPSILRRLGEPSFPFQESQERADELRGDPFRIRGELLDAETRTRVGDEPEYWCHLRSDGGHEFYFVSVIVPEELFVERNYVVADGFFFKHYSQRVGEERVTAPLFVGRQLRPSFPVAEPVAEPDPVLLAEVQDPPMGVESSELDRRALWHLFNVARTTAEDPERLKEEFADPLVLDYELLSDLAADPSVYRGKPFEFGGLIRAPHTRLANENPLREDYVSEAWLRNQDLGDHLLYVLAPGRVDFERVSEGPVLFRGWFLQLYAYHDRENTPRRVPAFVMASLERAQYESAPFVGQITWIFIGLAVGLGVFMWVLVRRDRKQILELERKRRERRQHATP